MKIVPVFLRYDYGIKSRGDSLEYKGFYSALRQITTETCPFWYDEYLDKKEELQKGVIKFIDKIKPDVLVDATMAKRNIRTRITDVPLVIGMGPGFYAGRDVHIVVETNHSNNLGRVILEGEAERDTGTPVAIGGLTKERVIWAPQAGIFATDREIGDSVVAGEVTGRVGDLPLEAPISGMLRGLLRNGVTVSKGSKLIEVDPVNDRAICNFITDKMRTIGDGVLEAIMLRFNTGA